MPDLTSIANAAIISGFPTTHCPTGIARGGATMPSLPRAFTAAEIAQLAGRATPTNARKHVLARIAASSEKTKRLAAQRIARDTAGV